MTKKLDFTKIKKPNSTNKIFETDFLTFKTKKAFSSLQKVFTKISILYYFNPIYRILIDTDTSGYTINEIFSQLTLN